MPASQLADVRLVHGPTLHRIVVAAKRPALHPQRRLAASEIARGQTIAAVPELDAGERTVGVYLLDHEGMGLDVFGIPKRRVGSGQVVRTRVDGAVLGVDDAPAAFGLDATHRGQGLRKCIAHTGAMGHLIEPILGGHRTDLHRLEEDVVTGVTRHGGVSLVWLKWLRDTFFVSAQ